MNKIDLTKTLKNLIRQSPTMARIVGPSPKIGTKCVYGVDIDSVPGDDVHIIIPLFKQTDGGLYNPVERNADVVINVLKNHADVKGLLSMQDERNQLIAAASDTDWRHADLATLMTFIPLIQSGKTVSFTFMEELAPEGSENSPYDVEAFIQPVVSTNIPVLDKSLLKDPRVVRLASKILKKDKAEERRRGRQADDTNSDGFNGSPFTTIY